MTDQHPITPPPELVEEWIAQVWHEGTPVQVSASDLHLASKAAEWGARWGHQPAPPADGEVAELAAWLYQLADKRSCNRRRGIRPHPSALTRAAVLLQRQALVPVSVSERLPGDQLCWWFEADEDCGYGSSWTLLRIRGSATGYTHWLPAHALPIPQQQENTNDH